MTDHNGNGDSRELWPKTGIGSPRSVATIRPEAMPKRVLSTVGFLLDTTRRRRSGRFLLWMLVAALTLTGVYMLSFPVISNVIAKGRQDALRKQFNETLQTGPGYKIHPVEGQALTNLVIRKLHVDDIVVEGVSGNALRAGVGHYTQTALPGASTGNIAIAGHRTGFGEPFRYLNTLKPGDEIDLITPFGKYEYAVMPPFDQHSNPWITSPDDWSVIQQTPDPELTLTTCDPPHTSLRRMIVRARLFKSLPRA